MNTINNEQICESLKKLEIMHPEASCALNYDNLFQLVVAVSLSAQTTDVSVNNVTRELFARYPEPKYLANANNTDVEKIIHSIGLYKNKAKNIISMAKMLVDDYNGAVPSLREDLEKLPGVGRKTANVILAEGYGEPAIAVDTHVFRVSNRIGITDESDVLSTERKLMKVIPKDKWIRTHHLLIFHGRKICKAKKPLCEDCLLNNLCNYYSK